MMDEDRSTTSKASVLKSIAAITKKRRDPPKKDSQSSRG